MPVPYSSLPLCERRENDSAKCGDALSTRDFPQVSRIGFKILGKQFKNLCVMQKSNRYDFCFVTMYEESK